MHYLNAIVAALSLPMGAAASGGDLPQYRVTDLTALTGGRWGTAHAIDGDSNVFGEPFPCGALWTKTDDGWTLSSAAPGCGWDWTLTPTAVASDGTIVGYTAPTAASSYAFVIQGGVLTFLPTGTFSAALGVNAGGQVVGHANFDSGFLFDSGEVTYLPAPSSARSITDSSTIVGASGGHAALWHLEGGAWSPTPLGIPASQSEAIAANDAGQVAGNFRPSSNEPWRPFLWESGVFVDLGTMGGWSATAVGITPDGTVVGWTDHLPPEKDRVFIWHEGVMHDLNDLAVDEPFQLRFATAVSKRGEIVGWSEPTGPGGSHAYIATPIVQGDLNLDARTDGTDLGLLLNAWGTPAADLDGDGTTDGADVGALLSAWTG